MRKTIGWFVLITLLTVLLAACGEPALGPKETAESFLTAMEARSFLDAYQLLSADSQATVTPEEFKQMLDNAWDSTGVAGFHVESVQEPIISTSQTRASVPYSASLTTSDGDSIVVYNALSLVYQNEHWYVIWPPVR
jgi:hypothetical protein